MRAFILCLLCVAPFPSQGALSAADLKRPTSFPHRIWAASDFEGRTHLDYAWFGKTDTNSIPQYPGNRTALRASPGPYENHAAIMAGINPVPGPRMGKENWLYLRYFLRGGTDATLQHFSLTTEDNWHVSVRGLTTNTWADLAVNFTAHARRNDGSAQPFGDGERMDDFKMFAGPPAEASKFELLIDDVIFFANDPALPPDPEPFPNRIIFLAAFDTGEKEKYWPGDFTIADNPPPGAYWRAARSVPKPGIGQMITLPLQPPRPVGAHTKLRFRFYLAGAATRMTVQIFDATVQDNRRLILSDPPANQWHTTYLDFSRNSHRNDGTANSPLTAGNLVDDIFFFLHTPPNSNAVLFIDEVVLFDAGK